MFVIWRFHQETEGKAAELQGKRSPSKWLEFKTAFQHLCETKGYVREGTVDTIKETSGQFPVMVF